MKYQRNRSIFASVMQVLPAGYVVMYSVLLLAGCEGGSHVPPATAESEVSAGSVRQTRPGPEDSTTSPILSDLASRTSALPDGSAYESVASAVLAASPGIEAAELGLARLRAKAQWRNRWPMLTPTVTLDSLAGFAASLMVDQPIIGHGRRKAERERATAEVDLAAVTLSMRQNDRVFNGLSLYLSADEARAKALIAEAATKRLASLHQIVLARVAGGVSDSSEEQVIAQTVAEMQAMLASDRREREQVLTELAALAGGTDFGALTGTVVLSLPLQKDSLSVLRANSEGVRTLAEARITRAAALPGLSLVAPLTEDGATPGLRLGGVQIGLGNAAAVAVADATPELVATQIAEARQLAARRRTELLGRIATLRSSRAQGAEVFRRARENLDLFSNQYRVGSRSLTDLTTQTAAVALLERDHVTLSYDIARLELELARDAGALVDGGSL